MSAHEPWLNHPKSTPTPAFGPPLFLKGIVIALIGATVALTVELSLRDVEPRWWRSVSIGLGLGLGYLAYEIWIGRRRAMISEGRDPDAPMG